MMVLVTCLLMIGCRFDSQVQPLNDQQRTTDISPGNEQLADDTTNEPKRVTLEGYSDLRQGERPNPESFFCFQTADTRTTDEMTDLHERLSADGDDEAIADRIAESYDIFFDADHGIATNAQLDGWELGYGSGGIIAMGEVPLAEITQAPEDGYEPAIAINQVQVGKSFCVRTGNGTHYAKFKIIEFDSDEARLEIEWSYQADGSRDFD